MSRLARCQDQRGASVVEMALVAPVFFGVIGLALFAAHIYEVKSDLQRVAQRAAHYSALRCDYRGNYAASSGCATGDYRSASEVLARSNDDFGHDVTFVDQSAGACDLGADKAVFCRTFDPATPSGPVTNQRVRVVVKFRYETPLAPFLRAINVDDALVDLEGRGEATVE